MKKKFMSNEFTDVLNTIGYEEDDDVRITENDYLTFMFFYKLLKGITNNV